MTDFAGTSRTMAIQFEPDTTPVPEPMSLLLMSGGIAVFAARKRWLSR
jgi:hypothetical protein